ncbi:ATP-binding cassette domain-containing protein [Streptomyces microflavus]|uniref:ATP-binding cassette domain-containing protein n=1 Tax=Streptomyces microflavus TaxID=1919 RepID=UPI002E12B33B|nr:ATP-binding cassette domain-containing protein [Streptomyces microflavus]WSR89004.1 ATP-binding cassette domain-containing protein [Streptomyces microflavus]
MNATLPIEVSGLVQGYPGRTVVNGLDLSIGEGIFGLLGPNGAGKTTLLKTLATTSPPRVGTVRLLGHDVADRHARRAARREVGFLPQDFGYFPSFTALDFVRYCAWLREVPRARIDEAARETIRRVGLDGVRRKKLQHLSGGMLRRCGIAQAVVADPKVIILDEPTVGLDPEQRLEFRELLRELGESSAIVFSTHLVEDIAAAADTVAVFSAGAVVFRGTPDALASLAGADERGDSPIERGYMKLLAQEGVR